MADRESRCSAGTVAVAEQVAWAVVFLAFAMVFIGLSPPVTGVGWFRLVGLVALVASVVFVWRAVRAWPYVGMSETDQALAELMDEPWMRPARCDRKWSDQ